MSGLDEEVLLYRLPTPDEHAAACMAGTASELPVRVRSLEGEP